MHMPLKASLKITWVDRNVLKQLLNKPKLVSMNNSTARLRFDAQVRRECDCAKMLFEKIVTVY